MAGGAYVALSGLRSRIEQLDRLASDLANVGTAGYKSERVTTVTAERPDFGAVLQSAIDVAPGPGRLDLRSGPLVTTGRDLDFAIEGRGFFVVDTPAGPRYTRNGQFTRSTDGTLTTADGMPVQGESGTPMRLPAGAIEAGADGTLRAGGVVAGRLRVVDFDSHVGLAREEAGRFRAPAALTPRASDGHSVKSATLEQSNVSVVDRVAQLTEVSRGFEALQRGLTILMNDVEGRAISELGRR
jgi:flagellar basal-body rod protein FlgF